MTVLPVSTFRPLRDQTPYHGRFNNVKKHGVFQELLDVPPHLLAAPLSGQCLLRTTLVTRLQIEGVFLNVLDDVLLLHLAFESTQGTLDRFTILNSNFRQLRFHPLHRLPWRRPHCARLRAKRSRASRHGLSRFLAETGRVWFFASVRTAEPRGVHESAIIGRKPNRRQSKPFRKNSIKCAVTCCLVNGYEDEAATGWCWWA